MLSGAAAVAGLFGPIIDFGNRVWRGGGFVALLIAAALASAVAGAVMITTPSQAGEIERAPGR